MDAEEPLHILKERTAHSQVQTMDEGVLAVEVELGRVPLFVQEDPIEVKFCHYVQIVVEHLIVELVHPLAILGPQRRVAHRILVIVVFDDRSSSVFICTLGLLLPVVIIHKKAVLIILMLPLLGHAYYRQLIASIDGFRFFCLRRQAHIAVGLVAKLDILHLNVNECLLFFGLLCWLHASVFSSLL